MNNHILTIMEFLSNYNSKNTLLIIMGEYIPKLYTLYPNISFIFLTKNKEEDSNVINEKLNINLAKKILNKNSGKRIVLFLFQKINFDCNDEISKAIKELNPYFLCVLFLLNKSKNYIDYFDGEIYFPIYKNKNEKISFLIVNNTINTKRYYINDCLKQIKCINDNYTDSDMEIINNYNETRIISNYIKKSNAYLSHRTIKNIIR